MDMLKHPGMADIPELLEKLDALRKEGKKSFSPTGATTFCIRGMWICWNAARRRAMCWCSG